MKVLNKILAIGAFALLMSACGGSDSNTNTGAAQQCQANYVFASQVNTCVQSCGTGMGIINGTCQMVTAAAGGTTCTAGQVYTQYGCLAQGNCQAGTAFYSGTNSCIPATQTGVGTYPGQYPTQPGYPTTYPQPGYPTQPGTYPGQSCFITQYGCLYQGSCFQGQVTYNGMCYNLIPPQGYTGGYYGGGGGFHFRMGFGN